MQPLIAKWSSCLCLSPEAEPRSIRLLRLLNETTSSTFSRGLTARLQAETVRLPSSGCNGLPSNHAHCFRHIQGIAVLCSSRIGSSMVVRGKMTITEREEHGKDKVSFRCSDVGPKNCEWQISGNSEAEIMSKIEQHGREKH